MATAVQELFDRVLLLEDKAVITLTFSSITELQSKRVMLFREKKKYEERMKKAPAYKAIFISQEVNKKLKIFKLHLSTDGMNIDWFAGAIMTKDGIDTSLNLSIDKMKILTEERLKKLQKEEDAEVK